VAPESPTHHGFQHITPRIAVIIPLYNGEKYIAQALDSVFA
jgi:hypothetical protein